MNEERNRNSANLRQLELFNECQRAPVLTETVAPAANISAQPQSHFWSESIPPVVPWPAPAQNFSWIQAQLVSYQINRVTEEQSIADRLTQVEERLLRLHDINALGSIDVDYFSEELLAIKKNHAAMLSVNGHLSSREQKQLAAQLSLLEKELDFRTSSSFGK